MMNIDALPALGLSDQFVNKFNFQFCFEDNQKFWFTYYFIFI